MADESLIIVRDGIDLLLGDEICIKILLMKQIRRLGMPILQMSRLGCIVGGHLVSSYVPINENKVGACFSVEQKIPGNRSFLSQIEQYCEAFR